MRIDPTNPVSSTSHRHRRAVGVFPTRQAAEHALHELRDSGFAMDRASVIARDADRHDNIAGADVRDHADNKADDGAKVGALSGGALGGLTGLLVGLGTLAIPGVGPILLAGAGATALATTVAGGAIGAVAGGLVGALVGMGIPEDRAKVYSDRVARGDYLVMLDGTDAEISRAESILHRRGVEDYGVYDAPDRTGHTVDTVHPGVGTTSVAPGAVAGAAVPGAVASGVGHDVHRHDVHRHDVYQQRAVGFFSNLRDVEGAVTELRDAGFPLRQVSIVAQNVQRRGVMNDLDIHNRLDGGRFGVPGDRISFLQNRIDRGDYMLSVAGTEAEVRQAAAILNKGSVTRPGIQEFHIYNASDWQRAPEAQPQIDRSVTPGVATTGMAQPGVVGSHVGAHKRAIGAFEHRRDAEAALTELRNSGFSMNQVSLIAKDADRQGNFADLGVGRGDNRADEGAKAGAATGGALGGLGGLLVGLGALAIPGIGPVIAGGAAATALATALTGGAIGAAAGGLTGGLVGMGIPEDRAKVYNDRFNRGDYLIMVDGSEQEVRRAEDILNRRGIRDWSMFDANSATRTDATRTDATRVNTTHATGNTPEVVIDDRRRDVR